MPKTAKILTEAVAWRLKELYIDIALSLELFVSGSFNIFNHQTNVDVDIHEKIAEQKKQLEQQ